MVKSLKSFILRADLVAVSFCCHWKVLPFLLRHRNCFQISEMLLCGNGYHEAPRDRTTKKAVLVPGRSHELPVIQSIRACPGCPAGGDTVLLRGTVWGCR